MKYHMIIEKKGLRWTIKLWAVPGRQRRGKNDYTKSLVKVWRTGRQNEELERSIWRRAQRDRLEEASARIRSRRRVLCVCVSFKRNKKSNAVYCIVASWRWKNDNKEQRKKRSYILTISFNKRLYFTRQSWKASCSLSLQYTWWKSHIYFVCRCSTPNRLHFKVLKELTESLAESFGKFMENEYQITREGQMFRKKEEEKLGHYGPVRARKIS